MTRSQYGLIAIAIGLLATGALVGKAFGTTKTLIVYKVPDNFICQPFRTESDEKANQDELKKIGAKPVMDQMLSQAFKAQSEGKGELIRAAERVCKEHPGSIESSRATTYYFVSGEKKVTTR